MSRKRGSIAIIEFSDSHHECIYSQILFLKEQYNIYLICNEKLRNFVCHFDNVEGFFFLSGDDMLSQAKSILADKRIGKVILNTASGREVLKFVYMCLFMNVRFYGVQHNIYRFLHVGLQSFINFRMSGYFVLADYIHSNIPSSFRIPAVPFYPSCFKLEGLSSVSKPDDEFWVVIPGGVNFKRRNFFELIEGFMNELPAPNVKFVIFGRVARENKDFMAFKTELKNLGLYDRFVFFEKYIPNELFYSYINQADLILPLINTNVTGRHFNYTTYQVSGTFNLSWGFKRPMLLEDYYKKHEPFASCSFFYTKHHIAKALNRLAAERSLLDEKRRCIEECELLSFDFQQERFLSMLR